MSDVPTRSNLPIKVTWLSWQAEAVSDVPDEHTAGVALEPATEQPDQLHPLFLPGLSVQLAFSPFYGVGGDGGLHPVHPV